MAKKTETATKIVSLSETEGKKVVKIDQCELEDQLVFDYFKNNVKAADYDDSFKKALHIGVLALMEDRIQQFLVKTESDLGVELLNLKYKYDLHQAELKAGQTKGREGETDILTALNTFFQENKLNDEALPTGDKPRKGKNKTGDIVCYLKDEDGKDTEKTIGIESKFSSAVKLGDITSMTSKKTKTDTAWSQLLETDYNRDTNISMIVFDRSWADDSILEYTNDVRFIPQVGFIVIIDSQSGHFENLYIAYKLARDIAMNAQSEKYDQNLMKILVERIIKDVKEIQSVKSMVDKNIKSNEDSIKNNQKILDQLEKNLRMMQFNEKYLQRYLQTGELDKASLWDFYMGSELDPDKRLEKEVKALIK